MVSIYCLKDPRDLDIIKYIGKTNNPKSRYAQHKCQWKKKTTNNKINSWIRSLALDNINFLMEIIDECEDDQWDQYEKGYVLLLKSCGAKLKNGTNGGNTHSVNTKKKESLDKRRMTLKGRKRPMQSKLISDLHKEGVYKNFGFKHYTQEQLDALNKSRSEAMKRNYASGRVKVEGKKVSRINILTKEVEATFNTIREAATSSGCNTRYIWKCLAQPNPNQGKKIGFIFKEAA